MKRAIESNVRKGNVNYVGFAAQSPPSRRESRMYLLGMTSDKMVPDQFMGVVEDAWSAWSKAWTSTNQWRAEMRGIS